MASMQCNVPELLEKLSDEARLYLLRRMASHNLTLLQALFELAIRVSKETTAVQDRSSVVCSQPSKRKLRK